MRWPTTKNKRRRLKKAKRTIPLFAPEAGHYQYGFAFDDNTVTIKPISRADVADFLLNQVTDTAFLRQTVGISG